MNRFLQVAWSIAGLAVALFFAGGFYLEMQSRTVLLRANGVLARLEGLESKANATLINLDTASRSWADSEKAISTDVADTMLQARGTLSGAQEAFASIPPVAQHLQGTADAGTALLASAKGTTDQLPATLAHVTADFDATQAPIAAFGQDAADLDALLKDEAIHRTLVNTADLTSNADGVVMDGRQVADKLTEDFTAKKPWWKKIGPSLEDVWDYGALVARHTPKLSP